MSSAQAKIHEEQEIRYLAQGLKLLQLKLPEEGKIPTSKSTSIVDLEVDGWMILNETVCLKAQLFLGAILQEPIVNWRLREARTSTLGTQYGCVLTITQK